MPLTTKEIIELHLSFTMEKASDSAGGTSEFQGSEWYSSKIH